jgi:hypothetical protein
VFETELLLRIAELAGEYCRFKPGNPVKTANLSYGHKDLISLISKATSRPSQTAHCPAMPQVENNDHLLSGNFIFNAVLLLSLLHILSLLI